MKLKNKIIAGIAGVALALGGSVVAAPAANAASNTYAVTQGTKTLCYRTTGINYNYCMAPGKGIHNVDYVIVPAGRCVSVGVWSFTVYCSSKTSPRWITLPGGYVIAKANW